MPPHPCKHLSLPSAHVPGHLRGRSLSSAGKGRKEQWPGLRPLPLRRGQGSEGCGCREVQCGCGPRACGFPSFSLAQKNFGDEGDDGTCRLVRIKLRKEVTYIFPGTSWLLGHETKDPAETKPGTGGPRKPCGVACAGPGRGQQGALHGGGSIWIGPSVKRERT